MQQINLNNFVIILVLINNYNIIILIINFPKLNYLKLIKLYRTQIIPRSNFESKEQIKTLYKQQDV